mgnify:FL=1
MVEWLKWSFSLWIIAILANLLLAITLWGVLNTSSTLAISAIFLSLTVISGLRNILEIRVDAQMLRVGRATLDRKYIREVIELDRTAMKRERGVELDPAAYLAIKSWIPTGLKILLNDPKDPTPYWLISSKNYREFAQALKN